MADNEHLQVWQKPCGEADYCVEVCISDEQVLVRSSREPQGAVLTFNRSEWSAFCDAITSGRLR